MKEVDIDGSINATDKWILLSGMCYIEYRNYMKWEGKNDAEKRKMKKSRAGQKQ